MSFTEKDMHSFSQRCKAFMASLQNLRQEGAKLEAIYTNETGSGSDPEWTDTNGIAEAEHVDAILMFQDLKKLCENLSVATLDRQQWITPFIQDG